MLEASRARSSTLKLTRSSPAVRKPDVARTRRWVAAWLVAGAVLALLLLANAIQNYLFVARLVTVQQVRQRLSQQLVALERSLRRAPATAAALGEQLEQLVSATDASDRLLWVEIRGVDGTVLARRGSDGGRLFSSDEQSTHFRNRQALYKVVPVAGGEAVVEVFRFFVAGLAGVPPGTATSPAGPPPGAPPGAGPPGGPRPLVAVELAAPLAVRDAGAIWSIRRNLIINCSGAVALLAAVVATGLGFRSYERGRRMETQLEIAREVQAELLPSGSEACDPVRLATVYRPAEQVSGDFYDAFRTTDGRIAIVAGDVSGKGVPAALVMGVIHGAVRSSRWPESAADHERESVRLNTLLCEKASGARYASMFWCYYEPATRQLCYVNAGHCPPLLVGARDGGVEIRRLDAGGPVLGLLPDARYEQACCDVWPGDVLVLYSDGLSEATGPAGDEYGERRLRELLATARPGSQDDVRDAIVASASAFLGSGAPRDDVTLVVAKFV